MSNDHKRSMKKTGSSTGSSFVSFLLDHCFFSNCNCSGSGMRKAWTYQVFLSFRGPYVRRNFVDHLYNAFTKEGIHVFLDVHQQKKGEDINATIKHAIECNQIRIPIFSPDYATSVWCVKEVSLIAQQEQGRILPLFYKMSPSHVRHPDRPDNPFFHGLFMIPFIYF
jgi:hypothetical protein